MRRGRFDDVVDVLEYGPPLASTVPFHYCLTEFVWRFHPEFIANEFPFGDTADEDRWMAAEEARFGLEPVYSSGGRRVFHVGILSHCVTMLRGGSLP